MRTNKHYIKTFKDRGKGNDAEQVKKYRKNSSGKLIFYERNFSGYKSSQDKEKFPIGATVEIIVNEEKDLYDHKVVNNVTGEIEHEEHETLTEHSRKQKLRYIENKKTKP